MGRSFGRRGFVLVVLAGLFVGCTPTGPPPTTGAPTTMPTSSCGSALPPAGAAGSSELLGDEPPLSAEEAVLEAVDAAEEATATGTDFVAVTSLDPDGRPQIVTAPVDRAVDAALTAISDPRVEVYAVEAVGRVSIASDPMRGDQWGMTWLSVEDAWACGRGAGTTIAVVDTGVLGTHPDLAGRVQGGASVLDLGPVVEGDGDVDPDGHGTHVAGIAAAGADNDLGTVGFAPEATILPVRCLDETGNGFNVDIAKGITWAVDQGADVINLSLSSTSDSSAMAAAVDYANANGVVVVAAAGNDGPGGPPSYPAADNDTVAVASFAPGGGISGFSTAGSYVDVAAPGSSILSTTNDGAWGYKSGTSMATPHVAGLAALVRAIHPSASSAQIRDHLAATTDDAGVPGWDTSFGWGRINGVRAIG